MLPGSRQLGHVIKRTPLISWVQNNGSLVRIAVFTFGLCTNDIITISVSFTLANMLAWFVLEGVQYETQ